MDMNKYLHVVALESEIMLHSIAILISSLISLGVALNIFAPTWHPLILWIGGSIGIITSLLAMMTYRKQISRNLFLNSTNQPMALVQQYIVNAQMKLETAQAMYQDVFETHSHFLWQAQQQIDHAQTMVNIVTDLYQDLQKHRINAHMD